MDENKKYVLKKPMITKVGDPNNILLSNVGRKGNEGFVPMITIAGILALAGVIIMYIVFSV